MPDVYNNIQCNISKLACLSYSGANYIMEDRINYFNQTRLSLVIKRNPRIYKDAVLTVPNLKPSFSQMQFLLIKAIRPIPLARSPGFIYRCNGYGNPYRHYDVHDIESVHWFMIFLTFSKKETNSDLNTAHCHYLTQI
jgi:hypothetical protein